MLTKMRQIVVDAKNYNALKDLGRAGDSFNDVIRNLITNSRRGKASVQLHYPHDEHGQLPDNESGELSG